MRTSYSLLIRRALHKLVKQPQAPIMGFAMSLFFLIVYNAGIGGIGFLESFGEVGYLTFVFPITIVSLAMGSSSGAGQALNDDMQSGYFKRLYLSPVPRWSLVVAPIFADVFSTLLFSSLLLGIGFLFGLSFKFGVVTVLGVLLLSLLWAVTLCGFSVGLMLRTGKHQNAAIVTNAVFPLLFLSTTFLPRELITSKWLLAVSWANPVTYLLEGIRYLLAGMGNANFLIYAVIILLISAAISLGFALRSASCIKF